MEDVLRSQLQKNPDLRKGIWRQPPRSENNEESAVRAALGAQDEKSPLALKITAVVDAGEPDYELINELNAHVKTTEAARTGPSIASAATRLFATTPGKLQNFKRKLLRALLMLGLRHGGAVEAILTAAVAAVAHSG